MTAHGNDARGTEQLGGEHASQTNRAVTNHSHRAAGFHASGNSSGRSVAYYCDNGSLRVVSDGEPGQASNGPDEYDEELAQSLLDQAGH